jgi:hypothetical protein
MGALYLKWQATRTVLQRGPLHHHHPMRIGNFVSFSHFWSWRDGISPGEMRLLKACRDALPS